MGHELGVGTVLCICKYTQWALVLAGRVCNPEFIIHQRLLGLHLAMRGRGRGHPPPTTTLYPHRLKPAWLLLVEGLEEGCMWRVAFDAFIVAAVATQFT